MINIALPEMVGDAVWARVKAHTAAEFKADIEPTGYQIIITICPAVSSEAVLMLGSESIDLGTAVIDFD